ncbi:MAG TPA: AAA family ATPase [Ktedonobacterales bacterium]
MNDERENIQSWSFPFCPMPPDWRLSWERIQAQCDWIQAMRDTPQDPLFHAEGDVLIHTRMVAEALIVLDEWRALPQEEREALFAAALLHDVAKPACTVVEPDGRISSKKHARKGESLAREILWRGIGLDTPAARAPAAEGAGACGNWVPAVSPAARAPAPFAQRERIAKLVRYHGLPLWFLEKSAPERAVIEASQTVRLDRLALLAEVDVRGRICADQQALLGRIELFREFCQEQRCYHGPRSFANAQSRFLFFRGEGRDPEYTAYDDSRFEVVLMAGLPGVGKDRWIAEHCSDWPIVSLDRLRQDLKIASEAQQGRVIQVAKEQARALMRKQQFFVWNATNVTRLLRSQLIDFFTSYHARVRIVYVEAPFDEMLRRNAARPNPVPEAVIYRLMRKLEVPDLTEAHVVEWISS